MTEDTATPIDPEDLAALGERILELPDAQAEWVMRLYQECVRARLAEAEHLTSTLDATARVQEIAQDVAQIVLDAAEWLRTLWEVGYMGSGQLPASPRTRFPQIEIEDIAKSALLARIRSGLRPLPFPPPTRNGVPWHEIVEAEQAAVVDASPVEDGGRTIAFAIDGDTGWDVLAEIDSRCYRVQHRGKGPLYRLDLSASPASLSREAPSIERTIQRHERAGIQHFTLLWIEDDGKERSIPLRAASPDRAEIEAQHWIAREHPERYGQVAFVTG